MAYKWVDVEIELDKSDVLDFIKDADKSELDSILEAIKSRNIEMAEAAKNTEPELSPAYEFIAHLHRELSLFGVESMLQELKGAAFDHGFILNIGAKP